LNCWALVPIKARPECKRRLSGWLSPSERVDIVQEMVGRVLSALRDAKSIDRIAIVTPQRDLLHPDVLVLGDPGRGLNSALDSARRELVGRSIDELVVLHADLPFVTAADIELLVSRGRRTGLALASDTAGSGTNALYLASPAAFRFHFGVDSCRLHLREGARLGLAAELVRTRGLEFDLDTGEDLLHLRAQGDSRFASLNIRPAGGAWLPPTR
jgi:2-phospho-L-lactate guanylyltransferase